MRLAFIGIVTAIFGCSSEPRPIGNRSAQASPSFESNGDALASKPQTAQANPVIGTASVTPEKDAGTTVTEKTDSVSTPVEVVGPQFALDAAQAVNQNLGTSKAYKYKITPAAGFTGSVNLAIDRTDLDVIDAAKAANISVVPATVDFSAGTPQEVVVTVDVSTMSPSVTAAQTAGHFKLIGTAGTEKIETNIGMTINPVFEMQMKGSSAATMVYTPNLSTINFKAHATDLKLRFINMDVAAPNIVHGNGSIVHQSTKTSLVPSADGIAQGGTYEVVIKPGTVTSGAFYSHTYETGAASRVVNFGK